MGTKVLTYGALKLKHERLNLKYLCLEKENRKLKAKTFYLGKLANLQDDVILRQKQIFSPIPALQKSPASCSLKCRTFCAINHSRFNIVNSNHRKSGESREQLSASDTSPPSPYDVESRATKLNSDEMFISKMKRKIDRLQGVYGVPQASELTENILPKVVPNEFISIWQNVLDFKEKVLSKNTTDNRPQSSQIPKPEYKKQQPRPTYLHIDLEPKPCRTKIIYREHFFNISDNGSQFQHGQGPEEDRRSPTL